MGAWQRTVQEWYQLVPRPLRAQGQSYCVQAVNSVQSQHHIVMLQLVDEDGNRVELVILICLHDARVEGITVGGSWGRGSGPRGIERWASKENVSRRGVGASSGDGS